MKYYKATDSRGNEWATSRSNPDRVVRYFTLTIWNPHVSWTAKPSTLDGIIEVVTDIVEIDAKEYRQIMKKRDQLMTNHLIATKEMREKYWADREAEEAVEEAEEPTEDSDTNWIDDFSEKQFTEEKITLRLTYEQLCKLTIQTDVEYGASKYDPIVSEGVMDLLREKRLETEAKIIAFDEFCRVVSEKFGTDNVADAKELLKIPHNKKIFNKHVKINKTRMAAN